MVDPVLDLVDQQESVSGVGHKHRDAEEAYRSVAETLQRDRAAVSLDPNRDAPHVPVGRTTAKHCHSLHLVPKHEVERRYREVLLFCQCNVVPEARRIPGCQRFRADGFAFGGRGKVRSVVKAAEAAGQRWVLDPPSVELGGVQRTDAAEKRDLQDLGGAGGGQLGDFGRRKPPLPRLLFNSEHSAVANRPDKDGSLVPAVASVEQGAEIKGRRSGFGARQPSGLDLAALDQLGQRELMAPRGMETDGVQNRGLSNAVSSRNEGHGGESRDCQLPDTAETADLEVRQLGRAEWWLLGHRRQPRVISGERVRCMCTTVMFRHRHEKGLANPSRVLRRAQPPHGQALHRGSRFAPARPACSTASRSSTSGRSPAATNARIDAAPDPTDCRSPSPNRNKSASSAHPRS